MGFMDKAKKMAEQAQAKLDEVQKQFNENQTSAPPPPAGPITEYDEHGRPIAPAESTAPSPPPAPPAPEAAAPPPAPSAPQTGAPAPPAPPSSASDADRSDEYAPPKLSSGDPLEG